METIGYLGGILLTICGIPEVVRTIKDGRCHLGWNMLVLWFLGEVFMIGYAIHLMNAPLIMNYVFNFFVVAIMLYYKIKVQLKTIQSEKEKKLAINMIGKDTYFPVTPYDNMR